MTTPPTPPDGWPTEPPHQPARYDHSQPPVYVYMQPPPRTGPTAGMVLAGALGGGALMLTAAISAMALALCAVSVAICALVCRWIIADIRKGKR